MSNWVVCQQIRHIEVFDIMNPRYNEPISPVPWRFIKSRFHCSWCRLFYLFQTVTVHMTDEEMDNFVFAVLPKKTAAKMQKELQDLVTNFILRSYRVAESCLFKHFILISLLSWTKSIFSNGYSCKVAYYEPSLTLTISGNFSVCICSNVRDTHCNKILFNFHWI